jgi:hypothetical protein
MIVKNPNVNVKRLIGTIPSWTADGYKSVKAIALSDCSTAKLPGCLIMTSSGWGFQSYGHYAATGTDRFGVNINAAASGEIVEIAIEGFVSDVSLSRTGTVTTCYSTFTRGYAVQVNATGHLTMAAATWIDAYYNISTASAAANAVVGIALSSGDAKVVHDIWLIGKPSIHPTAT